MSLKPAAPGTSSDLQLPLLHLRGVADRHGDVTLHPRWLSHGQTLTDRDLVKPVRLLQETDRDGYITSPSQVSELESESGLDSPPGSTAVTRPNHDTSSVWGGQRSGLLTHPDTEDLPGPAGPPRHRSSPEHRRVTRCVKGHVN